MVNFLFKIPFNNQEIWTDLENLSSYLFNKSNYIFTADILHQQISLYKRKLIHQEKLLQLDNKMCQQIELSRMWILPCLSVGQQYSYISFDLNRSN